VWLPWSKTSTLALSSTGIALSIRGEKPQLLTDATFECKDANQLTEILAQSESSLKKQSVNVVLSNTFVRYLVLPWQDAVLTQADWQAIAQHEFRKQFGATANDWLVRVNLGKHGQTVLAAAIDNKLYAQLQTSAEQLGFNVCVIEPLLMRVFNQHNPNSWVLVAEPQRLLLCQIRDDEWQQVVVDSPPAGQEYQHAEQLIQRSSLQIEKPHAVWMAGFSAQNKAQKIQLDFAAKTQTKLGDLILLFGALSLAAFLWISYQQIQAKINVLQQTEMDAERYSGAESRSGAKVDPAVQEQLKLSQQAQQQLNLPWMPMLAALETVKKANSNIQLLNISPNKNRAEIKLSGEAATFADITHLIDDLRANPAFSDAVLVSQHLEQDADRPKSQVIYVFEINVGWRV
jgi:Fimbrial assembly protein (PilN)